MVDHDMQRLSASVSPQVLAAWHKGVRALFNKACSSNPKLTRAEVYELIICYLTLRVDLTSRDVARIRRVLIESKDLEEADVLDWIIRFKDQTPLLDAMESIINR